MSTPKIVMTDSLGVVRLPPSEERDAPLRRVLMVPVDVDITQDDAQRMKAALGARFPKHEVFVIAGMRGNVTELAIP